MINAVDDADEGDDTFFSSGAHANEKRTTGNETYTHIPRITN